MTSTGHSVYAVAMSGRVRFLHAPAVKGNGDHNWSFKCPEAAHSFRSKKAAMEEVRTVGGDLCWFKCIKVTTVGNYTKWEWS